MHDDFSSFFDFLPIGAYRSHPDGTMLRANPALVRINGYSTEAELLHAVRDIGSEWYVQPGRRREFMRLLARDGQVQGFVSEIHRHRTRERIWVREHAHALRDAEGRVRCYEGTVEDISDLEHSRDQVDRIADQVSGMVFRTVMQPDGTRIFSYVSRGVRELLGLTPEQVMADGNAIRRLWHPADAARVAAASEAARASGRTLSIEHRVLLADGSEKWLHVRSTPVHLTPQRSEYAGVVIDVTARKRAEARLLESNERWKLALNSTGDGVWDWNLQTGEETYSEQFLAMYGYTEADLAHNPRVLDSLTHPDDVPAMLRDREAHFSGRAPTYVNEHRVRCRDGQWKWVLSRGLVIERDAEGRPARMIGTHTDITARRQADALRMERDRAEAANQAKTQLLSRVSHELRTPLNAVLGFAQLLQRDLPAGSTATEWTGHILQAGRHLLDLVDEVLDLSAAQSGQLQLSLSDLSAEPLLEEAWSMVQAAPLAGRPPCSLVRDIPPALPPVRADRRRLLQVLVNLLSNAVKYNRPGGAVHVTLRADGPAIVFEVRDEGQGLTPEQIARLFSPFERLDAARRGIEGTGLGLSLSQQLAQAMGGTLSAHSAPGEGATFSLRLPWA
ncbi:PAS domain-containing sensor histidine kinase [Ideonella alba]|uniref:histidine kinase n=1 Tax=Ideonella alba TaxID=2824118 RepID=A0A941BCG9_9BURK|nr:PAS domain-containing protein [Ideonella alba]MBQ0929131.1 PAS domain-containing protein [Ideonella alba]